MPQSDDNLPGRPPKPVILVVDDEALLRMLASTVLEDAGYDVIEAATGNEAMRILAARPDIRAVFTDIQMPGTPDGLLLAHHVRKLSPHCAIVVASGRIVPSVEDLAAGARFMTKPYSVDAVVATFDELLDA